MHRILVTDTPRHQW